MELHALMRQMIKKCHPLFLIRLMLLYPRYLGQRDLDLITFAWDSAVNASMSYPDNFPLLHYDQDQGFSGNGTTISVTPPQFLRLDSEPLSQSACSSQCEVCGWWG